MKRIFNFSSTSNTYYLVCYVVINLVIFYDFLTNVMCHFKNEKWKGIK